MFECECNDEIVWYKLGKWEYNLCLFDCIYKFYLEEKKVLKLWCLDEYKKCMFYMKCLFVLIDCKSYYKKNIYYSVKDSLYFLLMYIDYIKFIFEYFRREINRWRIIGYEVVVVVCIYFWKIFVYI